MCGLAVATIGMTIAPERTAETRQEDDIRQDRPWVTIVWNDPINLKCPPPYTN
jgi:hypothetical protein